MPRKASKRAKAGILKRGTAKGRSGRNSVDLDSESSTLGLKISSINSLHNGFVENYGEPSGFAKGWRTGPKGYLCNQCHVEFDHMNLYRDHKQVCQIGQVNCKHCSSSFSTKCDLNCHDKLHQDQKLWCKICEVRFKSIQAIQEHDQQCHTVEITPEPIVTIIGNVTSNQNDVQPSNGVTIFPIPMSESSAPSKVNSRKMKCPMCPFESHDIPGLTNHIEGCKLQLADDNFVYCCSQCEFSSRFRKVFGDHYIRRLQQGFCFDQGGYSLHEGRRQPRKRSSTEWKSDDSDEIQILHQDMPNPAVVTHIIEPAPSASREIIKTKIRLIGAPVKNLIFTCPKCSKNYFTARSLEEHLKIDCTAVKTLHLTTGSQREVEGTVDSKSSNSKFVCSYSCRFCNEPLNYSDKVRSHRIFCKQLPHPQKSFVICDLCHTVIEDHTKYSRHTGWCAMNPEKLCDEVIFIEAEEDQLIGDFVSP
ncbi:hypothetical protein TCAL_08841 [Tigriopus californicus]|uniref:C2H2-type domain-containing protein n=1 Tax=Tigriopus californicus TaxID=6832 RepID=A0A553PNN7_TIGCA|nr:zinc finger protein 521-like [Tigriopus californicus]XP_059085366.1 zinc finger protein 521-like [Tigriopus californicus]TRY79294.1 hypothetical protein TCAL_08841 [Tigriopus californicus]|eukprot:TCALIF_08841-PA protein Name:"Protein of unknown function" AED:0.00 eAED:0.00 QI:95/1/1/1/0.5/0.66/3/234/474